MAYLFPYAGSERVPERPKPKIKKPRKPYPDRGPIKLLQRVEVPEEFGEIDIPPTPPFMRRIMFEVCRKYKVHPHDVVGRVNTRAAIDARQEYCYRCRRELNASFPRIGKAINRDHTTVLYAYDKLVKLRRPVDSKPKTD